MEIARCLLPDIVAYYKSEQGQKELAEWKTEREALKKEKSEVAWPRSETAQYENLIVKNNSEPISIYEIVRICYIWWPLRDSNPCYHRERVVS